MDVRDIDDAQLRAALVQALNDAGIDYLDDDGADDMVMLDGTVPMMQVAQHLKRILLAEPFTPDAEAEG